MNNRLPLEKRLSEKPIYAPLVPENKERKISSLFYNPILLLCFGASISYPIFNVGEYIQCREHINWGVPKASISRLRELEHSYRVKQILPDKEYRIGEFMFNLTYLGRRLALVTI